MRKLFIVAAAVALTLASTSQAEAGRRNRSYTRSRTVWQQPSQRQGVFARLRDFERRKNEFLFGWLR